eukprot:m51a1_g10854 hypothetical protein (454) ;mRNA; r:23804-28137
MHTHTLVVLVCTLAVGWVPTSLASSCPEVVYDIMPNNATGRAVLVVGLSAPFSGPHMGMGVAVRAGLEAAFARANEVSQLKFVLASLDDASYGDRHMNNTETLLCRGASGSGPAFAIAGTVGPSASEMTQTVLQTNIGPDGVPDTTTAGPGGPRTGVALARAGAGDEVNAVMAFLAHDWTVLNNTALFYEDTTMGGAFLSMVDKAGSSLELRSMAVEVVKRLLKNGKPKAVVLAAQGVMSAAVIEEMSNRGIAGVKYVAMAWVAAEELYSALPESTRTKLSSKLGASVYFSQVVPEPTGFGLEISRANFLDIIFREIRTFDLNGYKLGPYGDGVGSDKRVQTADDWCNQGAHEVFMSQMSLDTGSAGVFEVPSDISISSPGTRQMFSEIQTDVDVGQGPQEGFDEMMVAVVPQQLSAQDGSGMQGGVDLALASFSFSTGTPKGIDSDNRSSVV